MNPAPPRPLSRAFTLVELLVVIGVIALLVSILLPVLGNARRQAEGSACAANLKSLGQAVFTYATANKGVLPVGWAPAWSDSRNPGATQSVFVNNNSRGTGAHINSFNWINILNRMMTLGSRTTAYSFYDPLNGISRANLFDFGQRVVYFGTMAQPISKSLRCPSSPTDASNVTYAANPTVFLHVGFEVLNANVRVNPENGQPYPPILSRSVTDLYADTALMWDAPSHTPPAEIWNPRFGQLMYRGIDSRWISSGDFGIETNASSNEMAVLPIPLVDQGALASNDALRYTTRRFRPRDGSDPYVGEVDLSYASPVAFFSDASITSNSALRRLNIQSQNSDSAGEWLYSFLPGNLRFRHNNNSSINVLWGDGSVRSLVLNRGRTVPGRPNLQQHEFLRRYLTSKLPSNLPATVQ